MASRTEIVEPVRSVRRDARRAALVVTAAEAIEALGPRVGVEDIADHCGLARPLLYRYFSGRADLQHAIHDHAAGDLLSHMSRLSERAHEDFDGVVVQAAGTYLDWVCAHPNLSRYCLQTATAGGDVNTLRTRIRTILSALVIPHVYGDHHRPEPDSAAFVAALAGAAEGTAVWWLDSDASIAPELLKAGLARRLHTLIEAETSHHLTLRRRNDTP